MAARSRLVVAGVVVGLLAAFLSLRSGNAVVLPPAVRGKNNTVLFVVTGMYGLSNVHYATASALLEHHPEVAVHFASFPMAEKEVNLTSHFALRRNPAAAPVVFHSLPGPDYEETLDRQGTTMEGVIHPPGFSGVKKLIKDLQLYVSPWVLEDHVALVDAIEAIIEAIDPSVVALDSLFSAGIDAARKGNRLTAVVSPNMASDTFADRQPWGQMFWRYPV